MLKLQFFITFDMIILYKLLKIFIRISFEAIKMVLIVIKDVWNILRPRLVNIFEDYIKNTKINYKTLIYYSIIIKPLIPVYYKWLKLKKLAIKLYNFIIYCIDFIQSIWFWLLNWLKKKKNIIINPTKKISRYKKKLKKPNYGKSLLVTLVIIMILVFIDLNYINLGRVKLNVINFILPEKTVNFIIESDKQFSNFINDYFEKIFIYIMRLYSFILPISIFNPFFKMTVIILKLLVKINLNLLDCFIIYYFVYFFLSK